MDGKWSLLDEFLLSIGKAFLIEDYMETSGGVLLYHLIKRFLLSETPVILVAFANPFSHYDRIIRKLRDRNRIMFIDMLNTQFQVKNSGGMDGSGDGDVPFGLYERIRSAVGAVSADKSLVTILVDDISLMEVVCKRFCGRRHGFLTPLSHLDL